MTSYLAIGTCAAIVLALLVAGRRRRARINRPLTIVHPPHDPADRVPFTSRR